MSVSKVLAFLEQKNAYFHPTLIKVSVNTSYIIHILK